MALQVYRVLIDAQPMIPVTYQHAVISVAIRADNAEGAETEALNLLPTMGWSPLGGVVRTSNLTRLLEESRHDAFDSAYGDYARQWLSIIHDEAAAEGSSLHLLSVDYEYLEQPKRLNPPDWQ